MIVSHTQTKTEEQLLATPIVSNRSIPKDLTLESLDKFSLDSPASALTERSNNSTSSSGNKQKLTFRFSCQEEEPIILHRSRFPDPVGLSSRSTNLPNGEEKKQKDCRRRRPLSLVSSITTLIASTNKKEKRKIKEAQIVVARTSQLTLAKDILSCWARDFAVEILSRLNGKTGAFWLLPNNIFQSLFNIHDKGTFAVTDGRQLSPSQELRIRWNRRKKHRNLSFRKRREKSICVSGLPNQGQTCFLNSVLQSLASLEPFMEYLEGIIEYQEEKEHLYLSSTLSDEVSTKTPFVGYRRLLFGDYDRTNERKMKHLSSSFSKELLELLKGINNVDSGIVDEESGSDGATNFIRGRRRTRRKKLDPKALLHKIAKSNRQFSSYGMSEQQDAQELFASLMGVVIRDSELDTSSSDYRIEVPSCVSESRGEMVAQAKNVMGYNIAQALGSCTEHSQPMTSAFAHFENNKKESTTTLHGNGGPSLKLLDPDQISERIVPKHRGENDEGEVTNILSISDLLMRIGYEQTKFQAESARCSRGPATPDDSCERFQNYKHNFLEEKKQDYFDASGNTTRVINAPDVYQFDLASEKRRMRSTMSPITPSPLSGWLGSTLQCSKCKHVRPIQNAPFLDIPLVPTAIPKYLTGVYHNSRKPPSPNASPLPSCSLETCLEVFTSVESVEDVECRPCTIRAEIDRLKEEAMILKGAIETTERRLLTKAKGAKTKNNNTKTRELESLEETKCLRQDLLKVQTRMIELEMEDPDQVDDNNSSVDVDDGEDEEFFFGTTDARDKMPMKRYAAKKCLLLTRTPSILCCHIQRRYYDPFNGRMEKCVQFVEFPQFLDLSPYCAYGSLARTQWVAGSNPKFQSTIHGKHGSIPYQLQSVIEHRGNAFGGHYVSYRRDHTGSWFCISDSRVTPVSWRDVQTCQAYMLFYEAL